MKRIFLICACLFVVKLADAELLKSATYYTTLQHNPIVKSTGTASIPMNTKWLRGDYKIAYDTYTVNVPDITPALTLYSETGQIGFVATLDVTSTPVAAGIIGMAANGVIYVSTGTGPGAWVQPKDQ